MSGPLKPPDAAWPPAHEVPLEIVSEPLPCLNSDPLPKAVPVISVLVAPVTVTRVLSLVEIGPAKFKLPVAALKLAAPITDMGVLNVCALAELFTTPTPLVNVSMLPTEPILNEPAPGLNSTPVTI